MATAINNSEVKDALCKNCDCTGFAPAINYVIDPEVRQIDITDASVFGAGDGLKSINVRVTDTKNNKKTKQITVAGATEIFTSVDLAGFDLSNVTISATVVTNGGCKADLSIHNVGASQLTGSLIK